MKNQVEDQCLRQHYFEMKIEEFQKKFLDKKSKSHMTHNDSLSIYEKVCQSFSLSTQKIIRIN